jgi:hypothetical protein
MACLAVIAVVAASVAAAASPHNNYSSLYIHKTKCCSRCRCAAMPAEQAFIMAYGLFLQLSRQSILFIPLGPNKFVFLARSLSLSLSLYSNFVLRTSVRPDVPIGGPRNVTPQVLSMH